MNTDKTQKHHPSVYGSWQIIGASAAKEEVTETYDAPPSVPQDIQDTAVIQVLEKVVTVDTQVIQAWEILLLDNNFLTKVL